MPIFCPPVGVVFILLSLMTTTSEGLQSTVVFSDQSGPDYSRQGTVVVHHNNEEGGICWDGMTEESAKVLCYQFYGSSVSKMISAVTVNSPTIRLLAPNCDGSEDDIMNCPGSSWGDHSAACDRQLAARIVCLSDEEDGEYHFDGFLWGHAESMAAFFGAVAGAPFAAFILYKLYRRRKADQESARRQQQELEMQPLPPLSYGEPQPPIPPPAYGQAQPPALAYGQAPTLPPNYDPATFPGRGFTFNQQQHT